MTRKPVDPDAPLTLSDQQRVALWLHATGNTIQQVADLMGIKRTTAKEHLHRGYANLKSHTSQEAVQAAYEAGFFIPAYLREEREDVARRISELEERLGRDAAAPTPTLTREQVGEIQSVAAQLNTMSHVTEGSGLADQFKLMSQKLNEILRGVGETAAESPLDGAERALDCVGIRGVNRAFLGVVLEDHPEVKHMAEEWDWADTEVRDKISQHVICDMLGLTAYQYDVALRTDSQKLLSDFWEAHRKWM